MSPQLWIALGILAGLMSPAPARAAADWRLLAVPGTWEDNAGLQYDGFAWYRCWVRIPGAWRDEPVSLFVEQVDNAHEAWVNGVRVGARGGFPPAYRSGLAEPATYPLTNGMVRPDQWACVALRIFDHDGRGGFKGRAPRLITRREAIKLDGLWQFRPGDDPSWATPPAGEPSTATFTRVQNLATVDPSGHPMARQDDPLAPAESARRFQVPEDLEIELLLAEPEIAQPLQLSFDERGRLWVVEYRQYPAPAGLNVVSKDQFWRAVYDRVPRPPPHDVRGDDRITIHEDTDGDGRYDRHVTFVDGLNIATACAPGRGGVWVLNPPYLLFYRDADRDDRPDGPPEVHLEGFGLEDTHSVVNSLRWGPDGWLYAAQGSTVTGRVRRPGETNAVFSQGQNLWRYHPETRRYEIVAEGGGNAFGVELDDQARLFSGHNGGDTRGFHYQPGAYLRKGFEKHGQLANPHAYGWFPHMDGTRGERFTHTFVLYHGAALPSRYHGLLFGVEPLQGRVVLSELTADGSTFRTRDIERVVTSTDQWFRPVDIKAGPDGAIYIADWYDRQVTHTRNQEGNVDKSNGRVYRLKTRGVAPVKIPDYGRMTSLELVKALESPNQWVRQTALRLLADRRDRSIAPLLQQQLATARGQTALETLWALNLVLAP